MSGSCSKRSPVDRKSERGESRVKFLVTIAVLAVIAYAGYQYVPVRIRAYQFKDYMQQTVDKAAALGQSAEWVKTQLKANFKDYDVPEDASITTAQRDGRVEARVQFTRPISLPIYNQYTFDQTVKSTEFINIK